MANTITTLSTRITRYTLCAVLASCAGNAWAQKSSDCHVIGDTSGNDTRETLGSMDNPYGSLADVEADEACKTIKVLWSETALDGGILLKPGQKLEGREGPRGALPVITNSNPARHGGRGVFLSSDNEIRKLHVKDTWHFGIGGRYTGKLKIEKARVTGSGQMGVPAGTPILQQAAWPNVFLYTVDDVDIKVSKSDFGESYGSGLALFFDTGHAKVEVDDVYVSEVTALRDDVWEEIPGITIWTLNDASADVKIKKTTVEDIGRGNSNSDGMILLNIGSGDFLAEVDRYTYMNPDGDGGGSATGMEIGLAHAGDATFTAVIKNSVIEGSTSCGIQVLDFATNLGANRLEVALEDNEVIGNFFGICGWQNFTPLSDYSLSVEDNLMDANLYGVYLAQGGPNGSYDVFVEENTISNSGNTAFIMEHYVAGGGSHNVDAGGGALGSKGENRITGSAINDVWSYGMDMTAMDNWWGSETGPSSILALDGASVLVDPFLTKEPK